MTVYLVRRYYPLTKKGERFPVNDANKEPILEPVPASRQEFLQVPTAQDVFFMCARSSFLHELVAGGKRLGL